MLFGVSARDPLTFAGVAMLLDDFYHENFHTSQTPQPSGQAPEEPRGAPILAALLLRVEPIARDRERFTEWINRHVLKSRDHAEFLDSLAEAA